MKLISLNTWGGRAGREKLLAFFDKHREADIFCLQEIWSAPYEELHGQMVGGRTFDIQETMSQGLTDIGALLHEHMPFFTPLHLDDYGLLLLVKKNIEIVDKGEIYVYREKGYLSTKDVGDHARPLQYVKLKTKNGLLTVINFHGLWNGQGKNDSPDRITQSEKIVAFIKNLATPVVFVGDFNLNPETESLKMIEAGGLRNLIREYGVSTTRSSLYIKPEKFADYAFVSPSIQVNSFAVLPDEVSDHLALSLDFE